MRKRSPHATELDAELARCRDEGDQAASLLLRSFFGVPLWTKDVGPATVHRRIASRMGSRLFGPEGRPWPVQGALTGC